MVPATMPFTVVFPCECLGTAVEGTFYSITVAFMCLQMLFHVLVPIKTLVAVGGGALKLSRRLTVFKLDVATVSGQLTTLDTGYWILTSVRLDVDILSCSL